MRPSNLDQPGSAASDNSSESVLGASNNQPISLNSPNGTPPPPVSDLSSLALATKEDTNQPKQSLSNRFHYPVLAVGLVVLIAILGGLAFGANSLLHKGLNSGLDNNKVNQLGKASSDIQLNIPLSTVNSGSVLDNQTSLAAVNFNGNVTALGNISGISVSGNGSSLTDLNASSLTSGIVSNSRLSPQVTLLGQNIPVTSLSGNVLSSINGIASGTGGNINLVGSGGISVSNDTTTKDITISATGVVDSITTGTGLTSSGSTGNITLSVDNTVTDQGNNFNGSSQLVQTTSGDALPALNGSNLTNLNASNLTTGTVNDDLLSSNVTVQGNSFNSYNELVQLDSYGYLPALNGNNLTNLNASNITTGTLNDLRLNTNVTVQGNTFNGANQLTELNSLGYLPTLNGSNLTNLNASHIASGTIGDSYLSSNVVLDSTNNTLSGTNTFNGGITVNSIQPSSSLSIGLSSDELSLVGSASSTLSVTSAGYTTAIGFSGTPTGNINYDFDASALPGTYTICTSTGNCAGSGSGVTTPGGTSDTLAEFSADQTIANSNITDDGNLVTVGVSTLIQPATDSTSAFEIQNSSGTSNLFVADTTDGRIGIDTATPGYSLDVNGQVNASAIYVGGNLVCTSSGCGSSSGSGYYIQNSTNLETYSNFNIESASSSSVGGIIQGDSGQTADLLELKDGSGNVVANFTPTGNLNITGNYEVSGSQISSVDLSDSSNLSKLSVNQTFSGDNTFSGSTLIQPATDSTSAFEIQNSSGNSNLFVADTTDGRIGIDTATPGYSLDVNGDINISSGNYYMIDGVPICGSPGAYCAPAANSDFYIQNSTSSQTSANFNIQSTSAGSVVGILQGASGQSADLQQWLDSSGTVLSKVSSDGSLSVNSNVTPTGGVAYFNGNVGIGTSSPNDALDVVGDINASTSLSVAGTVVCSVSGCGSASGSGYYIQNQSALQQATSSFWISGIGRADGGLVAPSLDVASAGELSIGTANATSIQIGNSTASSTTLQDSGVSETISGANHNVTIETTTNTTTAFQVQTSSGSDVLDVDTTNSRVGIDVTYSSMSSPTGLSATAGTSGTGSLTAGTTYYYEVTAIDSLGGETTPSTEKSATAPTTYQNINLSWTAVTGAIGYRIYRGTTSGGETGYYSTIGTVSGTTVSYTDTGTSQGNTTSTPPTTNTAYVSTNLSNNNGQVSIGGNGTPEGQLYVSGTVPTSAIGSVAAGSEPRSVYVQGSYAYVANYGSSTLTIYNISNPSSPTQVGSVATGSYPDSVYVQGSYAYVTNYGSSTLTIYNISNPSSPTQVGSIATGSQPRSVYVQGSYAYVANYGSNTLTIYNISNPSSPTQVGSVATGSEPLSVYVQGSYAYVTNYNSKTLTIYNISNPSSPTQVGSVATGTEPFSVYVQGSYAYVANEASNTLTIYNISNPSSPTQVGSVATGSEPLSVYVQGSYAYVTNYNSKTLTIYNISNPSSPTQVGSVATGTNPYSVYVQGSYAYVANEASSTLTIYNLGGEYTSSLQAGSIETSSLQVDSNASVSGDQSITGGLTVGGTANINGNVGIDGSLTLQGALQAGNDLYVSNGIKITPEGTTGTTTYTYEVSAVSSTGGIGLPSSPGTTTTGNATLSSTNYNKIAWGAVSGASSYNIYRTVSTGTPSSTGLIGNTSSTSFNDTGLTASGSVPTTDNSGSLTINGTATFTAGTIVETTTNTTTAFQVQTSSGSDVLDVDTTNSRVGIDVTYRSMSSPTGLSATAGTSGTGSLTAGTTYYYEVTAIDSLGGETTPSSEVSATAPTTYQNINLSWTAVNGAIGYRIYRGTTSGGETGYYSTNTNSFTDTGTSQGNTTSTPPTTNTAYVSTNLSNNNGQVSIGGNGTPEGQLYVSGNLPNQPIGSLATSGSGNLYVQGSYAYQTGAGYLSIYDVSNPSNPVEVSQTAVTSAFSVVVGGDYAYVATSSQLYIYNISNPSSPTLVGSFLSSGAIVNTVNLFVQGNYVFYDVSTMINIVNVANPSNPYLAGQVSLTAQGYDIYATANYLYVTSNAGGFLNIYSISNPASPTLLSTTSITNAGAITVNGSTAYLISATSGRQLLSYDISNPSDPILLGDDATSETHTKTIMAIDGNYLYTSAVELGVIYVYNLANSSRLSEVGTFGSNVDQIITQGRYLYAIQSTHALQIYDLGGLYTQSLQTGDAEIGSLQVDSSADVSGSEAISGSLSVSGSSQLLGNVGITGLLATNTLQGNNYLVSSAPTVTYVGTKGSTTYSYEIAAINANGGIGLPSPAGSDTNGNATLTSSNYNKITWTAVTGAASYNIYRTASGGTPATTGLIGNTTSTVLNDTGLSASGTPPTVDTSESLAINGTTNFNGNVIIQNTNNPAIAFQINNGSGTNLLEVNSSGDLGIGTVLPTANLQVVTQTNTTTAFEVQNSSGSAVLNVDTANSIVTVTNLVVSASITIDGHIITGNSSGTTTVAAGSASTCTSGTPALTLTGNDTAGTVSITTATGCSSGTLATITFANAYTATPRVILTPTNSSAASLQYFSGTATDSTFTIDTISTPASTTTYTFNYQVMQ